MSSVVAIFRDILLLRRGPQDLPYSPRLLLGLAAVSVLVPLLQTPVIAGLEIPFGTALLGSVFGVLFLLGVLRLILRLRGFANRFVQTACAFLGTDLIFTAINLPLQWLYGTPPQLPGAATESPLTEIQVLVTVLSLPLRVWAILVWAHIFRHSLAVSLGRGIAIVLGLGIIVVLLASLALSAASA